ncbi:hypothetical protein [Sphingomonas aracearum]|uniref:Uncharacterized protein n=1 Tax=Sphingomonas aracearum TaxID=2283317 RepID=A0A369W0Q4_9SPHN|nr:hypothetical protein [Sphingomonas aracearum]RDE06940.1 hypothetical protein DVW87_04525 [Sphingomonas aracearum]
MKRAPIAVLLAVTALPAFAQTAAPAPSPAPASAAPTAASTPAPTSASSAAAKVSLDTPIEAIVADPKAKAVLDKDFGGDLTQHPMYDSFKGMSLNQVAPMSGGKVTPELLRKLDADFKAIK